MSGTLFVVATPIGNLEDITVRALRVLREVSLVAAEDTRRTSHLFARYGIATPTTSLHEHNEGQRTAGLVDRLRQGDDVALVSDAGTPTVSDPGHHLVQTVIEAGFRVEPIPGPSAALAALAVSGLSTETFTFLGFPHTRAKARNNWFDRLKNLHGTIVFFEAPHRIRQTLERLQSSVGDCRVAIAREMTKVHEELVRGPISEVLPRLAEPRGEFTIVAELGYTIENVPIGPVDDRAILAEFSELVGTTRAGRRQLIASLARKHGRPAGEIYSAIERAKKSIK